MIGKRERDCKRVIVKGALPQSVLGNPGGVRDVAHDIYKLLKRHGGSLNIGKIRDNIKLLDYHKSWGGKTIKHYLVYSAIYYMLLCKKATFSYNNGYKIVKLHEPGKSLEKAKV